MKGLVSLGRANGLSLSLRDDPSAESPLHTHSSPFHSSREACEHWLRFAFPSPFTSSSSLLFPSPHPPIHVHFYFRAPLLSSSHHRCGSISGFRFPQAWVQATLPATCSGLKPQRTHSACRTKSVDTPGC